MSNISNAIAIKAINNALKPFFIKDEGGDFLLSTYKSVNVYRLKIKDNNSNAKDDYGSRDNYQNSGESVKVVKWFSDYWLFMEIRFNQPNGILLTLSIFQGKENDNEKNQLFRAEWDDYGNGNIDHPQPHWHFLNNKSIENTFSDFVDCADEQLKDTFNELLKEEKSKIIDLSKFHFAMNGDWNNSATHVHMIDNETTLAKWLGGLLAYLKTELEYIDRKRYHSL